MSRQYGDKSSRKRLFEGLLTTGLAGGAVLFVSAIAVGLIAVWTRNPTTRGELGGTAGICGATGFILILVCAMIKDVT
jgi:hypothetical protein